MSQQEIKLQPIADNMDKYNTYREIITRYNRAIENGFYFEAIFIDYALIEDRLRSMLYHMAIFYNSEITEEWKTRPFSTRPAHRYSDLSEIEIVSKLSITDKMKIVRSVISWAHDTEDSYEADSYLSTLKRICENIDIQSVFDDINEWGSNSYIWKDNRDKLTHDLMNKNMDSVNQNIEKLAIAGMEISKRLDAQVKHLKKDNLIRKSIGAPQN